MGKKKSITGKISLYASPNQTKEKVLRKQTKSWLDIKVYKSKIDRNRIIVIWKRLYRLQNKNFYILQIAPDVN